MIPKIGSVFCTTLEEKNLYKKKSGNLTTYNATTLLNCVQHK